jgi:hypothetical protein
MDTNFAKIDRTAHSDFEIFKTSALNQTLYGHTLKDWSKLISNSETDTIDLIKVLM